MHFPTVALLSLVTLAFAQEAAPSPAPTSPASTLSYSYADSAENPQDLKQLMQKKCPDETCPKPRHITVTKNITKVQQKVVTKTIHC